MTPMDHPEPDDLSALVDGEADDAVSAHVESCGTCQEQVGRLRRVSSLVSDLPRPHLTDHERLQWRAAVAAELAGDELAARRRRRRRPYAAAAAAALAVLAIAGGIGITRRGRTERPVAQGGPTTSRAAGLTGQRPIDVADCRPRVSGEVLDLSSPEHMAEALSTGAAQCTARPTRGAAGQFRSPYSDQLSGGLVGLDVCLATLYDQVDSPLLPVYAAPTSFQGKDAVVVVFLTTFHSPPAAGDELDSEQAWVMDLTTCTPLNVATH